jgi:hypothetical protein
MAISRLTLIERIWRYLRSIEGRHVEPGRWEAHCVKLALAALDDGNMKEAQAHMHLALTPPELRTAVTLVGFSPENRGSTVAELRAELERITSESAAPP